MSEIENCEASHPIGIACSAGSYSAEAAILAMQKSEAGPDQSPTDADRTLQAGFLLQSDGRPTWCKRAEISGTTRRPQRACSCPPVSQSPVETPTAALHGTWCGSMGIGWRPEFHTDRAGSGRYWSRR